jgi:hypothetical protein
VKTVLIIAVWLLRSGARVEFAAYLPGWVEAQAGACVTDAAGRCEMRVSAQAWEDGLVRGELRWEGGARPVIAPGGALEYDLRQAAPGELRYETLPQDVSAAPQIRKREVNPALILLAVLSLAFSAAVYRSEKAAR